MRAHRFHRLHQQQQPNHWDWVTDRHTDPDDNHDQHKAHRGDS